MNASTLLESGFGYERVRGRKLLLIGEDSPWHRYQNHEMGQPPCLLSLPAFGEPYGQNNRLSPLESSEFSALLRAQEHYLSAVTNEVEIHPTRLLDFKPIPDGYLLTLEDGQKIEVDYIDFCIGSGPARLPDISQVQQGVDEYRDWMSQVLRDKLSEYPWQTADQYLSDRRPGQQRVGVLGRDGVADQCVDLAHGDGHEVWWIGDRPADPQTILPEALRDRLTTALRAGRVHQLTRCALEAIRLIRLPHFTPARLEVKVELNDTLELDRLIIANGNLVRAAEDAGPWGEMLTRHGRIFPADLLAKIAEKIPVPFNGQWAGAQNANATLRFLGSGIDSRSVRDILGDFALHHQHLCGLWRQLPRVDTGAPDPRVSVRERPVDHRLIPVQAAAVALGNGYLPHWAGVCNANTAFAEEFTEGERESILAARHDGPLVQSNYSAVQRTTPSAKP